MQHRSAHCVPSRSLDETYHEQHDNCADCGMDDGAHYAAHRPETREQPACNDRADDADYDVADEAEAAAGHNLARKPAGDSTDDEPNDESLRINGHAFVPLNGPQPWYSTRLQQPSHACGPVVPAARRPEVIVLALSSPAVPRRPDELPTSVAAGPRPSARVAVRENGRAGAA